MRDRGLRVRAIVGIAVSFVTIFLASRVWRLAADPPAFIVAYYAPPDELYYTNIALASFQHDPLVDEVMRWSPLSNGLQLTNWTLNAATWVTFELLGLTYEGLRGAAVLLGLVTSLGVGFLVTRGVSGERRALALAATGALLVSDFGFVLATRVVEPTIARLASAALTLVIATVVLERSRGVLTSLRLGGLALATILLVMFTYATNACVALSVALAALFTAWPGRTSSRVGLVLRHAVVWLAAAIAATMIYAAVYRVVLGHSVFEEIQATIESWSGRVAAPHRPAFVKRVVEDLFMLLSANSFKASPALAVAWLVALPMLVVQAAVRRRPAAILLATLQIVFVLQTVFVNDYPERKLVFLVPFAIAGIVIAACGANETRPLLIATARRRALALAVIALATAAGLGSCVLGHALGALRGRPWWDGPASFAAPQVLLVLAVAVACVAYLLGLARVAARAAYGCAVAVPLVSAVLAYDVVYRAPTYHYRDMMVAITPWVRGHTMAGALSCGGALYNGSSVALSPYFFMAAQRERYDGFFERIVHEHRAQYVLAYPAECPGFCLTEARAASLGLHEVARYRIRPEGDPYDVAALYRIP